MQLPPYKNIEKLENGSLSFYGPDNEIIDWLAAKSNFTYNSLFVSKHIDSIDFKFHTFSFSFVAPNEKDQVTYGSLTAEINDLLNQVNSINYHQNECFTRSIETMNLSRSLNDPRGEPFKESFQRQDKKKIQLIYFFSFSFFSFMNLLAAGLKKKVDVSTYGLEPTVERLAKIDMSYPLKIVPRRFANVVSGEESRLLAITWPLQNDVPHHHSFNASLVDSLMINWYFRCG